MDRDADQGPQGRDEQAAEILPLAADAMRMVSSSDKGVAYARIRCDLGLEFAAAVRKRGYTARPIRNEPGGVRCYEVRLKGAEPIAASEIDLVDLWSRLLVQMREYRKRDIELAKVRNQLDAAVGPGASARTVYVKTPSGDVPVEAVPAPSPRVEAVRAKLAARGYKEDGTLEPVDWQWVRDVVEANALDLEGIAEALARAEGHPWPPKDLEAAREAARSLRNRARVPAPKRAT